MSISKIPPSRPDFSHHIEVKTDKQLSMNDLISKFPSDVKAHMPPKPNAFYDNVKDLFAPLQSGHKITVLKGIALTAPLILLDKMSLHLLKNLKQPPI